MWDLIVSVPDHCLSFYLGWLLLFYPRVIKGKRRSEFISRHPSLAVDIVDFKYINMKDFKGRSPLYMYIEKILTTNGLPDDYEKEIRYLVIMGADVNTHIAENGMGILHMLSNSDNSFEKFKNIHMCLLQCSADINMKDAKGNLPLYYCIYIKERPDEYFDRCAYLIQNGAKIQEHDYEAGNFLLAALQIYKMETCTKILPQISEYLEDYKVVDEHGQNAMHYLFQKQPEAGCLKLFLYLTAAGVTFNRSDKTGRLPVMFTLQNFFEQNSMLSDTRKSSKSNGY